MAGVTSSVLGQHCGYAVDHDRSIDRRDYSSNHSEEPYHFHCTEVVHFTDNQFAELIGLSVGPFSFKAKPWQINRTRSLNLSWWSPLPPDGWEDRAREQVDDNLQNAQWIREDIGNSGALNGNSLCGPVGFVTSWKNILQQYANSRQKSIYDVEFRTLGTFKYIAEIMYAVLVCIRGDMVDECYPVIHAFGTEAFIPHINNEYFTWIVHSTIGFSSCRWTGTWDHVSFGFYCPTSALTIEPRLCRMIQKNATEHLPRTRRSEQFQKRAPENRVASEELMRLLRQRTVN